MRVLRRLFLFLTPYWGALLVSAALLLGQASVELVPPLLQRTIVDRVIGDRSYDRSEQDGWYAALLFRF